MADIYLLDGLTLPRGVTHESLPGIVTRFMADCWHGMSRTQMRARAKRQGLRLSFRATARCARGATGVFELRFAGHAVECVMLARLQRLRRVHGKDRRSSLAATLPPARDPRQAMLF